MNSKIKTIGGILFSPMLAFGQLQPVFNWAHGFGANLTDVGREAVVDHDKNVIILCYFQDTVDFDPSPTGSTNLAGCGFEEIGFAKYDPNGNLVWAKSLCGAEGDLPQAMALDDNDNLYITGNFNATIDFDPGPGVANLDALIAGDIFIAKYDSAGNYQWAHNMGSSSYNMGSDVAVDNTGAVYITGYFQDTVDFDPGPGIASFVSTGNGDFFLAKFDSFGTFQWVVCAGSNNINLNTWGLSVTTDDQRNVFCTGTFSGTVDFDPGPGIASMSSYGVNTDVFVAAYDSSGNFKWVKQVGGFGIDEGRGIAVSTTGNVSITGDFSDSVDFDPGSGTSNGISQGLSDLFLLQLDSSGNFEWAMQAGDTMWDYALNITTDPLDNVYITGYLQGTADFDPGPGTNMLSTVGGRDVFMAKYNPSGTHLWSKCFGGPGTEYGFGICIDDLYDVYVTGHFSGTADFDPDSAVTSCTSNGGFDLFISKYSQEVIIGTGDNMSDDDQNAITVYPNPFSTITTAELSKGTIDKTRMWSLTLFDLAGKMIVRYESFQPRISIERCNLKAGLYFYKAESENNFLHSGILVIID